MTSPTPLRVAIDARLSRSGHGGGVQQVVEGLATGLLQLEPGPEEYHFIGLPGTEAWLARYMSGPCTLHVAPRPSPLAKLARSVAKRWAKLNGRYDLPTALSEPAPVRALGPDVVHFPLQRGFGTRRPNVYHPHDLQHRHLPDFFSARERGVRDAAYGAMCAQASVVAVTSTWVKEDVAAQLGVPRERIAVIPLAPATDADARVSGDAADALDTFALPERFVFYPAQTWPHKNHLRLLEALALLKREGLVVPFVSSGLKNAFHPVIARCADELGIADQVTFLGYVSPRALRALYGRCTAVVIPSLFEAASFPLWEAFRAGAPAACSNVTSLPAQAGDAALVFDPQSPAAIAEAVRRLWQDDALRANLVRRGHANVDRFTWERTARAFRAWYRTLGGRPLSDEDRDILNAAPLL